MKSMPEPTVTEEIRKIIERDDKFIEKSLENLKFAADNCLPDVADIAVRIGHDIDRQHSVSELYLALGDQPEDEHHKVIVRTSEQKDKLNALVDQFVKGCRCSNKPQLTPEAIEAFNR